MRNIRHMVRMYGSAADNELKNFPPFPPGINRSYVAEACLVKQYFVTCEGTPGDQACRGFFDFYSGNQYLGSHTIHQFYCCMYEEGTPHRLFDAIWYVVDHYCVSLWTEM